ncbi:hypothetical protein [Chitinophaga sp.]|uniref:hypothetical protein n=1 Tax=Chitinophaga sp. TaxID=1869181 RepID=UPI0031D5CB42
MKTDPQLLKRYGLIVLFFTLQVSLYGQGSINFDAFKVDNDGHKKLNDENSFKRLINEQFSALITGSTKNSLGNFASVDLADASVSLAGNLIAKNGSIFTVKANGGTTDGFFAIFDNSKLNTQVAIDLQYNFLSLDQQQLQFNTDSADAYNGSINKIAYDYHLKKIELVPKRNADLLNLQHKKDTLTQKISQLNDRLKTETDPDKVLSLQTDLAKTQLLADSINSAITDYPSLGQQTLSLENITLAKLNGLSFSSKIIGFAFGWFSVGYKVNNNAFKCFNPTAAYDLQVTDTSFVSHEVRLQYSYYKWANNSRSYFYDAGIAFDYTDNFDQLKKKTITEKRDYGSTVDERSTTKQYNAYQGTYQRDLKQLKFYGDVYWFFFNRGAFHLAPEWLVKSNEKPIGNASIGFLMGLKDSKKNDGSIVNIELYYKFLDVFKATDTDYKLFERNSIGLRFTFPLQFKYK